MRCPSCDAEVSEGQKFCHECGASLRGVTDPTQPLESIAETTDVDVDARVDGPPLDPPGEAPSAEIDGDDDLWAQRTGAIPVVGADDGGDGEGVDGADANDVGSGDAAADEWVDAALAETQPIDAIDADTVDTGSEPTAEVAVVHADTPGDDVAPTPPARDPAGAAAPLAPPPLQIITRDTDGVPTVTALGAAGAPMDDTTTGVHAATPASGADVTSGAPATTVIDQVTGPVATEGWYERPESEVYVVPEESFRLRPGFVLAILSVLTVLLATVADVADVRTDRVVDGIPNQVFSLDSIGDNLAIAGFIGAAVMLIGTLLHCFGLRWGAGLASGAGLAVAGWATLTLGLVEIGLFQAQQVLGVPGNPEFTLTITREVGYFLVVGVGVLGGIVALTSLTSAGRGGRPGLDPWVAALGALAAATIVVGPMIPAGDAGFGNNFSAATLPWQFFAGRSIHLALLLVGGVVGFLLVRTYGLGLVAGTVSVATWLWVSSLIGYGDQSWGVGGFNIGTVETSPHAVTTVGVVATLVLLLVASALAIARRPRP